MQYFPFVVVAWILGVGLYGIVTSRHLVHLIMCLIVVQSSTYVFVSALVPLIPSRSTKMCAPWTYPALSANFADWEIAFENLSNGPLRFEAYAEDDAGNVERTPAVAELP